MIHDQMKKQKYKSYPGPFICISFLDVSNDIVLKYLFKVLLKKQKDIIWEVPFISNNEDTWIELHNILLRKIYFVDRFSIKFSISCFLFKDFFLCLS